ncbi:arfaptin-2 [Ischnura elegans]|uniref:arfaptin-2 n=1 Tax=Ischnura elegans TaxID=197161 RepID=UPI001ED88E53|nr:arfaptin-2 [Ischnura elegans]XP_046404626.1 arfaptin-2 [Ischnura elegans]
MSQSAMPPPRNEATSEEDSADNLVNDRGVNSMSSPLSSPQRQPSIQHPMSLSLSSTTAVPLPPQGPPPFPSSSAGSTPTGAPSAGETNSPSPSLYPVSLSSPVNGGSSSRKRDDGECMGWAPTLPLSSSTTRQSAPTTPRGSGSSATSPTGQNAANQLPRTLTSPSAQSRMESLRNWGISTYKCTRQMVFEKLGKTARTVDAELEAQIELVRDTQRKYANVLRLSRALTSHFYHVVQTQHALGESFSELAQKSPELREEFVWNAEAQRRLTRNGETLLHALHFFVSSVATLTNRTIEDTLLTVRHYEAARIEYDAYRADLESAMQAASQAPASAPPPLGGGGQPVGAGSGSPGAAAANSRLEDAQRQYDAQRAAFERLRSDVSVKLRFLDENRIKVMHKQLLLFHNAISAYFSGNQQALEATLRQFNIKASQSPSAGSPSWLEGHSP